MHPHEHPQVTGRNSFRYLFTAKHHGGGTGDDAQWLAEISEAEEFAIFDQADALEVFDARGYLYGVLRDAEHGLRELGTRDEQIAEFPYTQIDQPWHGYPVWPLALGAGNRRKESARPSREIFDRMVLVGLITLRDRKRLQKGKHT